MGYRRICAGSGHGNRYSAEGEPQGQRTYDKDICKDHNVVEPAINKIKFFRRIVTRYDKSGRNFLSFVLIAATIIDRR